MSEMSGGSRHTAMNTVSDILTWEELASEEMNGV